MSGVPWGGPFWNELDFARNCSVFGAYAGWIVTNSNEPPLPIVATFWRTFVPAFNSTQTTNNQIIDWHEWARSNRTILAGQIADITSCRLNVCQAIGSEIDGSLAGVGLLVSYGLEAILLTVYCAFAVLTAMRRGRRDTNLSEKPQTDTSQNKHGTLNRISKGLKCTRYDMFDAAAFLSLGIQATVIYRQVTSTDYRFDSSLQLIISAFTFFPLAAMVPLILDFSRRNWLKGAILVGLFIIHTAAWVLCTNNAQVDYDHNQDILSTCPQNRPPQGAVSGIMFIMAAMIWIPPLFGLCLAVVLCFYRGKSRKMWQAKWLRKVSKGAMVMYAGANFICMWGALVVLLIFFIGASWEPGVSWSLGQGLALTPWISVLVEFASILFSNTESGLSGRLPLDFKVVRNEKALYCQERDGFLNEINTNSGNDA
nr:uncharacterized protein CTRU02_03569 [Colletotrichum truncatum]KAF6796591.1 hypothetical protein CTRU02_03569 [Colletotrichum truncatum]